MSNTNTLNAMIAEAAKIAAAHKAQPAPEHVQAMHDLHENAKQALTRDEYTQLWERIKPAVSGVDGFAGRKWRAAHPDAPASPMPKAITDAQAKRKAEKAAQPKAEKPAAKKAQPKAEKPAAKKAQPKAEKQPTQKDMLAALLVSMQRQEQALTRLTAAVEKLAK